MKPIYIHIIILLSLTGCIREDMSHCNVHPGCLLRFVLYDSTGQEVFQENIVKTDVFIYNETGEFIRSWHLSQEELKALQGVRTDLQPGTYMAVCWANSDIHTYITDDDQLSTLDESRLYYVDEIGSDMLYYAPKKALFGTHSYEQYYFTIPPGEYVEHMIEFSPAYRLVDVYVKGYDQIADIRTQPFRVHINHMPDEHDFRYGQLIEKHDFYKDRNRFFTGDEIIYYTSTMVGLFNYSTPGEVRMENTHTGDPIAGILLADFIRDNHIDLEDEYDRTIEILFDFSGGQVVVSVDIPEWDLEPVTPGFE